MQIFTNSHFDFLGRRKPFIMGSVAAMAISLLSLIAHGGPKFGVDFLGGTLIQIRFQQAVDIGDVRSSVRSLGFGSVEIKRFADPREILIHVEESQTGATTVDHIKDQLTRDFAGNSYEVRRVETVGPRIGSELISSAFWAIIASLILMIIYISIRFEFRFALGAVTALFHDVLITLGVFSLLSEEVSLAVVAALLTIVGYSLNDTIVVFDRVRENMKLLRRENLITVLNTSINSTLSRTTITSGTTLLVVIALLLLGGDVIFGFAMALTIGIVVGTYSSIFIASPVLIWWEERRNRTKSGPGRK